MKYISFLFPLTLVMADAPPLYSPNVFKQQEETITQASTKQIDQSLVAHKQSEGATSDIMIVDPKIISQDWFDAFHTLQTKKLSHITFGLRDNTSISDVSSVEILSGGYLMLFSVRTLQGPKYKIVKTSDIISLSSK